MWRKTSKNSTSDASGRPTIRLGPSDRPPRAILLFHTAPSPSGVGSSSLFARHDALMNAVECMLIDFFDFLSKLYPADKITRYASSDISRLLRDRRLTLTDISDMFGFSSLPHFSQYMQTYLGGQGL